MNNGNVKEYYKRIVTILNERADEFLPDGELHSCIKEILMRGKKIRPVLTLLSFQAVGGNLDEGIPLAFAVELTHNATLIHDDIIDGDMFRRGKQSLHERYGINNAIVIGDAMISLAVSLSTRYGSEITKLLSQYGFDLCCGELMDISLNLEDTGEDDYMLKIKKKSASLFRASTHTGALAGNGNPDEVNALADYGGYIGTAYQIKDDTDDLIDNGNDLRRGIVTLPIIHLYKMSDNKTREFLREKFGNNADNESVKKIIKLMEEYGSFDYCKRKISENLSSARSVLNDLRDSEFKEYLLDIPEFILHYK